MSMEQDKATQNFDVNCINIYNTPPNAVEFYQSMVKRGHKINFQDKLILEKCEETIQKCNTQRKIIFNSYNINCHDFYYLLADKYNLNYINYRLVINSLSQQILKNIYRYIWVQWEELRTMLYKHYENEDFDTLDNDKFKLVQAIICHQFKHTPEYIDDIFDDKLRVKILDSFNKFSRKKQLYANFILTELQNYFIQ